MQRLNGHVQTYPWGKRGVSSEVARLFSDGHKDFSINKAQSYAELWMGTHPDGPARLQECNTELSSYRAQQEGKTETVAQNHLPFIMKIMSIRHTLSLQVHPTKKQAALLHEKDPKNYPDRNHKPELAYALTRFELLCGFRPAKEILINMHAFPELRFLMGEDNCAVFEQLFNENEPQDSYKFKAALKACFRTMIVNEPHTKIVNDCLESFKVALDNGVRGCLIDDTVEVLRKTMELFPGDVGCFAPLYLNHMILMPGECCYYAAEELHAYLSGECVECVGCSNNTIRAGLTNKFVDRDSLMEVLNYRMTDPDFYLVPLRKLSDHVVEYAPDCTDFTLHEIKIAVEEPSSSVAQLPVIACGSILVIVEGNVEIEEHERPTRVGSRGDIFYIPSDTRVTLTRTGKSSVLGYRTFSYEEGPDHSNRIVVPKPTVETLKEQNRIEMMKAEEAFNNNNNEVVNVSMEMDGFI